MIKNASQASVNDFKMSVVRLMELFRLIEVSVKRELTV